MTNNGPTVGPGWHPDPHRPDFLRYWDGQGWTDHTSPVPPRPSAPPRRDKPWFRSWWAVAAAVIVVVGGIAAVADEPADRAAASLDPAPTPTAPSNDADTVTQAAEPATADVPDLVTLSRKDAALLLEGTGLVVGKIDTAYSKHRPGTVLRQALVAGSTVALGTTVALTVATPIPRVPGTAGRLRGAAIAVLEEAGYRVSVTTETRSSGTNGAVLRQSPIGGTRMKPGRLVRLVVARIVRPVTAPTNCTPGYQPCLPPASDYDCAGGSGDGPAYAHGPVYVTGGDPYGLDNDGDGVACES